MSSDYGHLAQVRDRAMAEPHHPQKLVNVRLDYLDAVLKHYLAVVTECADQKGERAVLAAAPDLLAALQGLLSAVQRSVCEGSGPAQEAAHAAINRALGRAA